jgi:DNA-binding response OmpR family regulator
MLSDSPISRLAQRMDTPSVLIVYRGNDVFGLHAYLERAGFRVRRVNSDSGAVMFARKYHPDVVVLQADATDNGLRLMRQILSELAVPVIIAAAGDCAEPVEALDNGADDYIVIPAALHEIAARARAAVRRSKRLPNQEIRRQVGALELDGRTRDAYTDARRLSLAPSEYRILEFLARTPGHVVTRDDLIRAMGERHANPATALGQRVRRLRSKLTAAGVGEPSICVVNGVGYRLDA